MGEYWDGKQEIEIMDDGKGGGKKEQEKKKYTMYQEINLPCAHHKTKRTK